VERSQHQNAEGCVKTTEDLERYRALIAKYQPDLVVELGTFSGKAALWFARAAHCEVITVDVDPVDKHEPGMTTCWLNCQWPINQLVGSSIDSAIVREVRQLAEPFQRPLLILDSWHSGPHVLAEMEFYHDLVPLWGYMVVEDGIIRYNPPELAYYGGTGPLDGIEAFLRRHTGWSSDKDLENMSPTTQHPDGWLVRRA
jgi:cephalosporin hydroxylase